MTYARFVNLIVTELEIERPLKVTIELDAIGSHSNWDGYHTFKNGRHRIRVLENGSRHVLALLAHELIHAYMDEYNPKAKFHGKKFQHMARIVEGLVRRNGFTLRDPIYMVGIDE